MSVISNQRALTELLLHNTYSYCPSFMDKETEARSEVTAAAHTAGKGPKLNKNQAFFGLPVY